MGKTEAVLYIAAKKYIFPSINIKNTDASVKDYYHFDSLTDLECFYKKIASSNTCRPLVIFIGKYLRSNTGSVPTDGFIEQAKKQPSCIIVVVSTEIVKNDFEKLELLGDINIVKLIYNISQSEKIAEIVKNKNLAEFGELLKQILTEIKK